jgi:hypothetical protein
MFTACPINGSVMFTKRNSCAISGSCGRSAVATLFIVTGLLAEQALFAAPAVARTLKVPEQYPTIQDALDISSSTDTVLVAPGVYSAAVTRDLSNGGTTTFCAHIPPGVVLRSEAGSKSTEIHLSANDSPLSYALVVEADAKGWYPVPWTAVEGFTVTADEGTSGGSIFYTARVRIRDCHFKNLLATNPPDIIGGGAGIVAWWSEIEVQDTRFENCRADRGGAVAGRFGEGLGGARFRQCTFTGCTGAAVRFVADSSELITNAAVECEDCVFEENVGGAMHYGVGGSYPRMNGYFVCRRSIFRSNLDGVLFSIGFRAAAVEDCEFIDNTSSTASIVDLQGTMAELNEPSSVLRNLFVRNTAGKAIVDWKVSAGRFENNFFTNCNAQQYSVASLAPLRTVPIPATIQVTGNLFERNGPSPLLGISDPAGVPSLCNIVWENSGSIPDLPGFISIDPQLCEPGSGTQRVAASSPCLPENVESICSRIGNVVAACPTRGTTSIGLASNHPGRDLWIDGILYRTPSMFSGYPGDDIQLKTSAIQNLTTSERYVWNSWSDGGEIEHAIVLAKPQIYAMDFGREYLLRTTTLEGGHTEPVEQWVLEGSPATVTATPDVHYSFQSWTGAGPGSYSGSSNPATVTLNGPVYETALFQLNHYPVSVNAGPGGQVLPAGGMFPARSVVRIEARPDEIHEFSAWVGSGPGSYTGKDPAVDIVVEGPIEQTAYFTPIRIGYTLTLSASATDPGMTSAPPANGWRRVYFWAACLDRGISAFEGEVSTELTIGNFEPVNGVLNAGSGNHLLLAIPGCPTGPNAEFLLGSWNVFDSGGEICIHAAQSSGNLAAVDCDTPNPHLWKEPIVEGFGSNGGSPCVTGSIGCATVQMDPSIQELLEKDFAKRDGHALSEPMFTSIQPNPFTLDTTLQFELPRRQSVQVLIYDVRGRRVAQLFDGVLESGRHALTWNGRDDSHQPVSAGVFFARIVTEERMLVRKFLRVQE